jgi:hypothetical protein
MSAGLPMKKRSPGKAKRLIDSRLNQAQVLQFPDNLNRTYEIYSSFRSGSLFHERKSLKDVIGHALQLMLWFAVLTTFFASQRALLHAHAPQATPLAKTAESVGHARL